MFIYYKSNCRKMKKIFVTFYQKDHYRSTKHLYILKRRISEQLNFAFSNN